MQTSSHVDWALLQLRYEIFLLADAYKKDLDDPDRVLVPENHLAFYYSKYYKKQLNLLMLSLKTPAELIDLMKSTATITGEPPMLTLNIEDPESVDIFVKQTEEARRDRKRRSDAGDETALLKFNAALAQARPAVGTVRAAVPGIAPVAKPAWPVLPGKGGMNALAGALASWKGGKW